MKLQEIFRAIDELPGEELEQVRAYIENRRQQRRQEVLFEEDIEARIAALHKAFAELREGLSEDELNQIVWAMNMEYVGPKDLAEFANIDQMIEALSEDDA